MTQRNTLCHVDHFCSLVTLDVVNGHHGKLPCKGYDCTSKQQCLHRVAPDRFTRVQVIAGQAEGYDAADLRVLADRALHAAARRQLASGAGAAKHIPRAVVVSSKDLEDARQGFQPAAAWGVGHLQVCMLPVCSATYAAVDTALHGANK